MNTVKIINRCLLDRLWRKFSTTVWDANNVPKSFALSGSGWLIPFHLGVIERLRQSGYINSKTMFSGTSGGSLAGLLACSEMPTEEALQTIIALAKDPLFKKNIDSGMKRFLSVLLPGDILNRCNGRLHLTVTKMWPKPKMGHTLVSQFHSKDHLLEVVAASCFIPLYSGTPLQMLTTITNIAETVIATSHGQSDVLIKNQPTLLDSAAISSVKAKEFYIDGGVFAFMPPLGDVRVAPVSRRACRLFPRSSTPHIFLEDNDFKTSDLLLWALKPPSEDKIRLLYEKGGQAADRWLKSQGELPTPTTIVESL